LCLRGVEHFGWFLRVVPPAFAPARGSARPIRAKPRRADAPRDGAILIPTSGATRKVRNLDRDPRATVMIDDSRGGFDLRGVTLVGEAEIHRAELAREINPRIHSKYVEQEGLALEVVRTYLATDDVTIAFRPERVSSWDLRSTNQGRALSESGLYRPLD